MKKDFPALLWSSFVKVQGFLALVIALAVSLALWVFGPNTTVPLVVVVPVAIVGLLLVVTLGHAAYEAFTIQKRILPSVVLGTTPSGGIAGEALCLLEPSELFSHDALVSFYYIEEEQFERLIGIGTVVNIQEDGRIQVTMTQVVPGLEETVKKLTQNDATILKKTRVKPHVSQRLLQLLIGD